VGGGHCPCSRGGRQGGTDGGGGRSMPVGVLLRRLSSGPPSSVSWGHVSWVGRVGLGWDGGDSP
jgi:hypothetical protein